MSQAEHIARIRLTERVDELEKRLAELRGYIVDLENRVNAMGKTAMTAGKPKAA